MCTDSSRPCCRQVDSPREKRWSKRSVKAAHKAAGNGVDMIFASGGGKTAMIRTLNEGRHVRVNPDWEIDYMD